MKAKNYLSVVRGALSNTIYSPLLHLAMTRFDNNLPSIFTIGYYGHGNLGDEASFSILSSWTREIAPGHEIFKSLRPTTLKNLLLNYLYLLRAELVVFGSGNLFQSSTSKRSFYFYLSLLLVAKIFQKPVLALSQGVGPLAPYEKCLLSVIAGRMVWCSRDGTHPKFVRLIKVADICEGRLDIFRRVAELEKTRVFGEGHVALLASRQAVSSISTDRLHAIIAARQCDIPAEFADTNTKIVSYINWTKEYSLRKRIRLGERNKRILKWGLRWQGVTGVGRHGLLYSFNPLVVDSLKDNPFRIKRGVIDGTGVKIAPRFWGTPRVRGVDVTRQLLAKEPGSRILIWGMSTPTYQKYGCPWKHISGYDSEISLDRAISEIIAYQPSIVFVCQNSPEQETRGQLLSSLLPSALIVLVGGSFDALYGNKRLFPGFIHALGIEWLATAIYDPKKIRRLPRVLRGAIKGFKVFQ